MDGVPLINGWLASLEGNTSADLVEDRLKEPPGQLRFTSPDADRIRELLLSVADLTSPIAQRSKGQEQAVARLENVATALRKLAGQL